MFVLPIGRVQAVENHNLSWGVEVGDRFDYHFATRSSVSSSNRDYYYYVEIDSLPTIPTNVTESPRITASSVNEYNTYFSFYFMNDTEVEFMSFHWSAYPIGNWSLVKDLSLLKWNYTEDEVDIIDTETEWGMVVSVDEPRGVHTDTLRYSKSDGALNLLEMNWQNYDDTYLIYRTTRLYEGIDMTVVIGAAAVFGLAAVVVVVLRKRSVK